MFSINWCSHFFYALILCFVTNNIRIFQLESNRLPTNANHPIGLRTLQWNTKIPNEPIGRNLIFCLQIEKQRKSIWLELHPSIHTFQHHKCDNNFIHSKKCSFLSIRFSIKHKWYHYYERHCWLMILHRDPRLLLSFLKETLFGSIYRRFQHSFHIHFITIYAKQQFCMCYWQKNWLAFVLAMA